MEGELHHASTMVESHAPGVSSPSFPFRASSGSGGASGGECSGSPTAVLAAAGGSALAGGGRGSPSRGGAAAAASAPARPAPKTAPAGKLDGSGKEKKKGAKVCGCQGASISCLLDLLAGWLAGWRSWPPCWTRRLLGCLSGRVQPRVLRAWGSPLLASWGGAMQGQSKGKECAALASARPPDSKQVTFKSRLQKLLWGEESETGMHQPLW